MSDSPKFAFEASPHVASEISAAATKAGAQASKPVAISSPADALDSPIGGEEIKQILELVVVAFKAGGAALVFFNAVKETLKKFPGEAVLVKDPLSGKTKGTITNDTTESEARKIFGE